MNQTTSIKKNFIYNILYQIISLITPLITAPYVSRVLGVDNIGVYSFTQSMVSYFGLLAAISSGTHGQRGIAGKRNSKYEMSTFFYEVFILRVITTFVSLMAFILFSFTFGGEYLYLYLIQSVTIIACAFDITWLFQGLENFKITVTRQILIKLIGVFSILLFVKSENDLWVYTLCYSLPTLVGNLLLWPGVRKVVDRVKIEDLHPFRHLKLEFALFIPYVGVMLFSYVDKSMLGYICDSKAENGYYEQALKFITISASVVSALSTVMIPRMAYYFKNDDIRDSALLTKKGIKAIMLLSCLLAGGMFAVGPNVIPWFYGSGYEKSIDVLEIISAVTLFKGLNSYLGSAILIPAYKQGKYSIGIWISTVANIILNAALIPNFGAVGAAVASVISEFILYLLLSFYTRDYVGRKTVVCYVYKYLISGLIATVIIYIIANQLSSTWYNSLILAISQSLIYAICLFLLKDDIVVGVIKKVLKKK